MSGQLASSMSYVVSGGGASAPPDNSNYQQALRDLDELTARAIDGAEPVADQMEVAREIIDAMFSEASVKCGVYPNSSGEVVVLASGGYGRSVDVRCRPNGDFQCFVTMNGRPSSRAWFSDHEELSKGYLADAFRKVAGLHPHGWQQLPIAVTVLHAKIEYYTGRADAPTRGFVAHFPLRARLVS